MNSWYLDNAGSNGQHQVKPIMPVIEEPSPIGQLSENPHDDLNIE